MKRLRSLCAALMLLFCTAASAEPLFTDLSRPFEALFMAEGVEWTENSYRSENMYIQLNARRACDSDVYVADIYVRTAESLRRAFGGGAWNTSSEKISTLAQRNNAVLALTGDSGHHFKAGWVVGNGQLWRDRGNNMRDLCVLYTDGSLQIHYATPDHELIRQQTEQGLIWQTWMFGPALLDENGKAIADFSSSNVEPKNPRAVIGYYEPGHYCLVQADGRGTFSTVEPGVDNEGMTLVELAQFMESLSCKAAYNLDGGQSAAMWFGDQVISCPYKNGRAVGDAIVLCEPMTTYDDADAFLVE